MRFFQVLAPGTLMLAALPAAALADPADDVPLAEVVVSATLLLRCTGPLKFPSPPERWVVFVVP